jgi:3-oxoacyl-[acyl-carrier-protein] synthase-3
MRYSHISYLDYHKPCYKLSVNEVLEKVDDTEKNKNYILKYSNLDEITIELRYNQFEMYDEMMEKYFESHSADEIRYLIFTGKDYFTNSGMSVPYYLVGKYRLKNAGIIALNQGCSGTPQGIELADHIIKADPQKKVMIVSLSKIGSIEERYEWPSVNGDAAGIMVLGSEGFLRILDCYSWSDGAVSLERCTNRAKEPEMDLMKRENLLMLNVKKMILGLLERNNLGVNDIHKFVPQSIHYLLYRMYAKSINVKLDRFFLDNIPSGGHLGDVDSTRNLKDAFLKYNKTEGSKYLLFTLGDLGDNFSYNAVLMESC